MTLEIYYHHSIDNLFDFKNIYFLGLLSRASECVLGGYRIHKPYRLYVKLDSAEKCP